MTPILFHLTLNAQIMNMNNAPETAGIFPKGDKAPADYFTGTAWV
ncbi:MAG: hypothetical protein JWP27_2410, partial [Flaviaesturariibacter sp.]|nr:hypothetical protein [Flaviaesturariibacter sp.]